MKRCPSCQRTYEDDTQTFCMNDGTPLESLAAPPSLDRTMMAGSMGTPPAIPPQNYPGAPQGEWATPSWPTNQTWSQPGTGPGSPTVQKKSKLPWILAGLAVVLIGLVGIGGAAAFFLLRKSSDESSNSKRGLGYNINKNDKASNANSSTSTANTSSSDSSHSNMNMGGSSSDSDVPTDKEAVTKQLYDFEYAWCAADLKGDKAAMDRLLAPEFVSTNADGTTQNKKQYLDSMKPDQYSRTCNYSDFSLGQSANYAVIIGYNTVKGRDANGPFTEKYKFTDTFVWRDGHWLATASKSQVVR